MRFLRLLQSPSISFVPFRSSLFFSVYALHSSATFLSALLCEYLSVSDFHYPFSYSCPLQETCFFYFFFLSSFSPFQKSDLSLSPAHIASTTMHIYQYSFKPKRVEGPSEKEKGKEAKECRGYAASKLRASKMRKYLYTFRHVYK